MMGAKVTKVEVWAGEVQDRPGTLAAVLGALAGAGANLECVIARRQANKPGTDVVYVTPIKGKKVQSAAAGAGLRPAAEIATLRVEGNNKAGYGSRMTAAIGAAGVNLRGLSAAVVGTKFVAYLGFDSQEDAAKAAKAIKGVDKGR
jgi:hypothetical protein